MLSTLQLHQPTCSSRAPMSMLGLARRSSAAAASRTCAPVVEYAVTTMSWFGGVDGSGANPTTGKPFGNAAKRITTGRLGGMT